MAEQQQKPQPLIAVADFNHGARGAIKMGDKVEPLTEADRANLLRCGVACEPAEFRAAKAK